MEAFSFDELQNRYDAAPLTRTEVKNKLVYTKDITNCTEYIKKFFFPLKKGGHLFIERGMPDIYTKDQLNEVFFNKMPEEVKEWYFKKDRRLFTIVNKINQPLITDTEINLCGQLLHKYTKKFEEFPEEIKKNVLFMTDHIKNVLSGGKEETSNYVLKWFSNMIKGNKNDSILYFKSGEGTGKSTLVEFIYLYVVGCDVATKATAEVLTTPNNKSLCGKLLVIFEELSTFTENQWHGVSSKIKDWTTSDLTTYTDKYEKSIIAQNINNYIINTNVDAIKNSDGRRIFCPDISHRRVNDYEYFGNLKSRCFNKSVGEAFFSFLYEIDTTGFNAQKHMPETNAKLDAIASRLSSPYLFIKEEYVLKKRAINCKTVDLFENYKNYCNNCLDKKPLGKIDFFQKLKEINIEHKKINGHSKYNISYETLQKIAESRKWIHETDEYHISREELEKQLNDNMRALNHGLDEDTEYNIIDDLNKENKEEEIIIKCENNNLAETLLKRFGKKLF